MLAEGNEVVTLKQLKMLEDSLTLAGGGMGLSKYHTEATATQTSIS